MARLWQSGAELNSATSGVEITTVSSITISSTTVRSGAYSWRSNASANSPFGRHNIFTSNQNSHIYFRAYIYIASLPNTTIEILRLANVTNGPLARIAMTTGGVLQLRNNNGTQVGSNSSALSTNTWYRVELEMDASSSPGTVAGYIDGVSFASGANSSQGSWGRALWGGVNVSVTQDIFFDDLAVNDTTGSAQTGLPGSGKIIRLSPNAAGDANSFATAVGGTAGSSNNYTRVSEVTPDDATSYNASVVLNQEDLFNVTSPGLGSGDVINVVMVQGRFADLVAADATTGIKLELLKTSGGTKTQSANLVPNSTSFQTNQAAEPRTAPIIAYLNPDGAAWTNTTIDSMQIGYIVDALAVRAVAVTTVWAEVDYTPSSSQTITPAFVSRTPTIFAPTIAKKYTVLPAFLSRSPSTYIPTVVSTYLFGFERFETGSSPWSFTSVGNTSGTPTITLDSTSKVDGTKSLFLDASGTGGAVALKDFGADYSELYAQFKLFIPTSSTFGVSGYVGTLAFNSSADATILSFNVEDYGTVRLTGNNPSMGYQDTGLNISKGVVNTIEVRLKISGTVGVFSVWVNNPTQGSPNFTLTGINTGTTNIRKALFGLTFTPENSLDYYLDDVAVRTTFIGANPWNLSAPVVSRSPSVFAPTTAKIYTSTPAKITRSPSIFTPTITKKVTTLPAFVSRSAVTYAPTIAKKYTALPAKVSRTPTIFAPSITERATILPAFISRATIIYAPSITKKYTILPSLVVHSHTVYAPIVASGIVAITPSKVTRNAAIYAPTVTPGAVTAFPSAVLRTPVVYAVVVTPGARTATPGFISRSSQVFAPSLILRYVVAPGKISRSAVVYSPIVAPGAVTAAPSKVSRLSSVYSPTVIHYFTVAPTKVSRSPSVYAPSLLALITTHPSLVSRQSQVYAPAMSTLYTAFPSFVGRSAVVYAPFVSLLLQRNVTTPIILGVNDTAAVMAESDKRPPIVLGLNSDDSIHLANR